MAVTIRGPETLLDKQVGGQPNPFNDDIDYIVRRAIGRYGRDHRIRAYIENGEAVIEGLQDLRKIGPAKLAALVQAGCEIYNYPAWLELTPEQYNAEVPEGVPGREDDDGNVRTWAEWKDATHEHAEYGGKHYIGTNAIGGVDLLGSVLLMLYQAGIAVKTAQQMRAIVDANSPEV